MRPRSVATVPAALVVLCTLAQPSSAQTTALLSDAPGGADGASGLVALSGNARWAVFHSAASNLVPGDANGIEDAFLRDLWSGTSEIVSVATSGAQGDAVSRQAQVSEDGRFVVFQSYATNLVAGDTNGQPDIFLRDRALGTTTRISVSSSGAEAFGGARYPYIARDGRTIVYESMAANLVAGDVNGCKDVFVYDRTLGTTICVTDAPGGQPSDGDSMSPAISPDGRYIGFSSYATNLVANDVNGTMDVFVHDLVLHTTVIVSTDANGLQVLGTSAQPSLSLDGRYVAFFSRATALVPGDTNHVGDVFVKDLRTGGIVRASLTDAGAQAEWQAYSPRITPDGRFVTFFSEAATFVPGDTNSVWDAFVRDLVLGTTERATVGSFGQQANGPTRYPVLSDDGRFVAFESVASTLVPGDANGDWDVFLRDRIGSFHPFCAGDGSLSVACPCGNLGGPGRGCENSSTSGGGVLGAIGHVESDDVRLVATGLCGFSAIFLQGSGALAQPAPFGDGLRCASGQLLRLFVAPVQGGGASAPVTGGTPIRVRSAQLGDAIPAGSARNYQAWYRDPAPGFCTAATSNVSSALRIDW